MNRSVEALLAWNKRMHALADHAPLRISCRLSGAVCMPEHPVALDSLLAMVVCQMTGQPLAMSAADIVPVEIPIQREPRGRFHMSSLGIFEVEKHTASFTNRRFPLSEAQTMGDPKRVRRILVTGGATKSFRIPRVHTHLKRREIVWFCVGNEVEIASLLPLITSVGKKRGVGLGALVLGSWDVRRVEHPWEGFPLLQNGVPLRPLPLDFPGLGEHGRAYRTLSYPYWDRRREEELAVPLC